MAGTFLESIRGLIGVKIGLFHFNNQYTEGTLLDVQDDHLVVQVEDGNIFYFKIDQIKAISKDTKSKKNDIDLSNVEVAESLDAILNELQYEWVTINNFNNQIFGGILSRVADDYVVLADNNMHFFIQKAHIANVYRGQYAQESEEENNNSNSDNEESNLENSNLNTQDPNSDDPNSNDQDLDDVNSNTDESNSNDPETIETTTQQAVAENTVTENDSEEQAETELQTTTTANTNNETTTNENTQVTNSSPNTMPASVNHLYTFASLKHNDPLGSTGYMNNRKNGKKKRVKSGMQSYTRFRNFRCSSNFKPSTSEMEEVQENNVLETNEFTPVVNSEEQKQLLESQFLSLMNFASKMADSQSQYLSLKRHAEKMHSQLKENRLINN